MCKIQPNVTMHTMQSTVNSISNMGTSHGFDLRLKLFIVIGNDFLTILTYYDSN